MRFIFSDRNELNKPYNNELIKILNSSKIN